MKQRNWHCSTKNAFTCNIQFTWSSERKSARDKICHRLTSPANGATRDEEKTIPVCVHQICIRNTWRIVKQLSCPQCVNEQQPRQILLKKYCILTSPYSLFLTNFWLQAERKGTIVRRCVPFLCKQPRRVQVWSKTPTHLHTADVLSSWSERHRSKSEDIFFFLQVWAQVSRVSFFLSSFFFDQVRNNWLFPVCHFWVKLAHARCWSQSGHSFFPIGTQMHNFAAFSTTVPTSPPTKNTPGSLRQVENFANF